MNFRETLKIKTNGQLEIGGVEVLDLVKQYKTPLYVLDYDYITKVATAFKKTLEEEYGEGAVAYASKAFSSTAIYKMISKIGLYSDVVSIGEIYAAIKGGMEPSKLVFHGNNKKVEEIEYAIKNKVGLIVIDANDEAKIIDEIAKEYNVIQPVLIRVNPGIEAHTHEFVKTAKEDSKFGFSIKSGAATNQILNILKLENLKFEGLHCHIGSQIFDKNSFKYAADIMTDYIKRINDDINIEINILNLGGGFGVYYTDEDPLYSAEDYAGYVSFLAKNLLRFVKNKKIKKPFLIIEPGRSLIAEAGITLYTIGAIKEIEDIKTYYAIDGGMFENPRYALYKSKYSAIVANKVNDPTTKTVTLTGKCCESGDMIAVSIPLQEAQRGDIIAVFSTGAYNYSMSSHYNSNLVPPVIMVKAGVADYIVRPEKIEDLTRLDNIPNFI